MFNAQLDRRKTVILIIFSFIPVPFALLAIPCAPEVADYAFRGMCIVFAGGSCLALFSEYAYGIALSFAMLANETAGGIVMLFWCGSEPERCGFICVETLFVLTSLRLFFTSIWHFCHFFYVIGVMGAASYFGKAKVPPLASAANTGDIYEDWSVTVIVLVVCLIGAMLAIAYLDLDRITSIVRRNSQRRTCSVEDFAVDEVQHEAAQVALDTFFSIAPKDNVIAIEAEQCESARVAFACGTKDSTFLNTPSIAGEEDEELYDGFDVSENGGKSDGIGIFFISESSLMSADTLRTLSMTSTAPMRSQETQTRLAWNGVVLTCASCSLPPQSKPTYAGKWVSCPHNTELPSNLHAFKILGEAFLDNHHEAGELQRRGDATYVLEGRISMLANGMLQRETQTEPAFSTYMRVSGNLNVEKACVMHTLSTNCGEEDHPRAASLGAFAVSRRDASVQTSESLQYFCVCNHYHYTQFDGWWRAREREGRPTLPKKALNMLHVQGVTIVDGRGVRHVGHEVRGEILFPYAEAVLTLHTCGMLLVGSGYRITYSKAEPPRSQNMDTCVDRDSGSDTEEDISDGSE
eukprot:TRINITY_DN9084_c0_g2_i1.p1 TRINITY_DN9084_c0_g2~~TRINITY_DN9084_c0_g2_i1.p1  ORF type:complete len:578 (-),score=39.90 TRINITY_DN9084_c0_g2_i1:139-1872(-)